MGEPDLHTTSGEPATPERRRSRLARWFDSWMRSLGMALVLFLIIKTFFFEAFQIASGSMTRTLLTGDFLFVNKVVYGGQIPGTNARLPGFRQPRRGDVIVFAYPRDPHQDYVKRVIGTPGDTVEMRGGRVRVNGTPLIEPYVQRIDPAHDAVNAEFEWQRPYYLAACLGKAGGPAGTRGGPWWSRRTSSSCWATIGMIRPTPAIGASWTPRP
jgi:signal peptidase I